MTDTYRWRGDYGLLDRLAYRDSGDIPKGWTDTTIDPLKIQQSLLLPSNRLRGPRPNSIQLGTDTVNSDSRSDSQTPEVQKHTMISMIENVVEQAIDRPKKRFSSIWPFFDW